MIDKVKLFFKKSTQTSNYVLTTFMYILGIGITSFIGKLLNKKTMEMNPSHSSWKKVQYSDQYEVMY